MMEGLDQEDSSASLAATSANGERKKHPIVFPDVSAEQYFFVHGPSLPTSVRREGQLKLFAHGKM
jgi:hypothetical protein